MKTIVTFAKAAGALLVIGAAFLVLVVTAGVAKAQYSCPGEFLRNGSASPQDGVPATLYARIDRYRWFIFWADHDAMIFWEIQPRNQIGFGYYTESEFSTPITDLGRSKVLGSWSSLSRKIYVETSTDGSEAFSGTCQ